MSLKSGWQYTAKGTIDDATENILTHYIDMAKGQSGAPIYENDNGSFFAIGINTRQYMYTNIFLETKKR